MLRGHPWRDASLPLCKNKGSKESEAIGTKLIPIKKNINLANYVRKILKLFVVFR